jgi:nicotinamide-nucleotide amidase
MDRDLAELSRAVGRMLSDQGLTLATAESCTGGWVAQVVTHTAGSSAWFDRGVVTYANEAKQELLSVPAPVLETHGAVSEETARAMVDGLLAASRAHWALSVTGIAGPGGGSELKPVGTVYFAWGRRGAVASAETRCFSGDREAVRRQAVIHALQGLLARIGAGASAKTVP